MKKFIGIGNETPEQIKAILEANSDAVEPGNYFRKATPAQMSEAHEVHTKLSIDLAVLDDVKEEFMTDHKSKVKPIQLEARQTLDLLKNKGTIEKGTLYKFIDRDEQMTGFYAENGELIEERPAYESELRQTNIIGAIRQAGNE